MLATVRLFLTVGSWTEEGPTPGPLRLVNTPAAVHPLPEGEGWDLKFCRIVGDPSRKGVGCFS